MSQKQFDNQKMASIIVVTMKRQDSAEDRLVETSIVGCVSEE